MLKANLSSRGCICYHPVRTTTPVEPTVFLKTGMTKERSAQNVMLNEKEYTSLAIHKNPNPKIKRHQNPCRLFGKDFINACDAARHFDMSHSWVAHMVRNGMNRDIPHSERRGRGKPRNERP